jgi:hypothetical protein
MHDVSCQCRLPKRAAPESGPATAVIYLHWPSHKPIIAAEKRKERVLTASNFQRELNGHNHLLNSPEALKVKIDR